MIKTGCISQVNTKGFDEIWWIVRAPHQMPITEKHIPELSPSPELFAEYRRVFHSGGFNEEYFQNKYVPEFLRDLTKNEYALELLHELCEKSSNKNVLLCCYCDNESLCHRSIVAGILLGMGADIEINGTYMKYYHLFEKLKRSGEVIGKTNRQESTALC